MTVHAVGLLGVLLGQRSGGHRLPLAADFHPQSGVSHVRRVRVQRCDGGIAQDAVENVWERSFVAPDGAAAFHVVGDVQVQRLAGRPRVDLQRAVAASSVFRLVRLPTRRQRFRFRQVGENIGRVERRGVGTGGGKLGRFFGCPGNDQEPGLVAGGGGGGGGGRGQKFGGCGGLDHRRSDRSVGEIERRRGLAAVTDTGKPSREPPPARLTITDTVNTSTFLRLPRLPVHNGASSSAGMNLSANESRSNSKRTDFSAALSDGKDPAAAEIGSNLLTD